MNLFMGIDIGTSSVKTLLVDEFGKTIYLAQREYDIERPNALFAEQDMRKIWKKTKETIGEILGTYGTEFIRGIGFSGQMHSLVMLDKSGELIQNAILWCDQRSLIQTKEIYEKLGEQNFKQRTLNDLSSGFLLTSLLWIKENDRKAYERIQNVLLPKDYIRYLICGELATDYSDASATLMFDPQCWDWAWEIADLFQINHAIFPKCYEAWEIVGCVTESCAKETGLRKGIPVVCGGGDSIMQQIGNGVVDEKSPWIANIGTSCSVNCATQRPVFDRAFRINTFCHAKRNMWFFMGANVSGGASLKWLKNNILRMDSYEEMSAIADKIEPGSKGLLFLPYLSGARSPINDSEAQGMFFGLTMIHNRAHMIRSVMEGIVLGMKTTGYIFEECGLSSEKLIASGGGARSPVFLQIEADIFQKPVYVAENNEQSCLGAAIAAAVGTGYFSNYYEACENMVRWKSLEVLPIKENFSRYEESYGVYRELYQSNKGLFHKNRRQML